jgi:hypothetical protein
VCSVREREVADYARALLEAQGELAKVTLRAKTEMQDKDRLAHDLHALTAKLEVAMCCAVACA